MVLPPGTRLGPYEILEPIAAGGMGEVYRASDPRLGREVAIKVLPESVSRDPQALSRFEREARAVAALNHPNILAIHDVGTEGAVTFTVTELLDGETLRSRLRRSPLTWRRAVEVAAAIAEGLAAAHGRGIVHRDIKPENLCLTTDGRVKILDFGIARVTSLEQSDETRPANDTEAGMVLGTAGYMSPEQVRGVAVDGTSDIFSLGCVLYEMLASRRAFERQTAAQTMAAILADDPANLSAIATNVPPDVGRVVARCLEKEPSARFQSARDLAFALSGATRVDVSALSRPARRGYGIAIAIVTATLLIGAVAAGVWSLTRRAGAADDVGVPRAIAVLPLANLSGEAEQEYFADGLTEALIGDLSQISALRVVSRTSVMRFKGTTRSVPDIARELNVDVVLSGSVLRAGDEVRVTVHLIDAPLDRTRWSQTYDRDIRSILALQREVAQTVAREIRVQLTPRERSTLATSRPVDAEAHDLYWKGLYHLSRRTEGNRDQAHDLFLRAIRKDPGFASAHAALAGTYGLYGDYRKQMESAFAALRLDDANADAHAFLGFGRMNGEWDWEGAERELKRAIDLNPGSMTGHHLYSHLLTARGRHEESLAESRIALQLDPLNVITSEHMGWASHFARQYQQALENYRRMLDLEPSFALGHVRIGLTLQQMGRVAEAIGEFEKARQLTSGQLGAADLACALASAGRAPEARRILAGLEREPKPQHYSIALIHAALGNTGEVVAWLDKAADARSNFDMMTVNIEPRLDSVRTDPRFLSLVARLGLPARRE